ncbi:MAG: signal peptidase II [Actinobacteria bacterium]|nr:signal peptidase II [Actinomycetota bacterium]
MAEIATPGAATSAPREATDEGRRRRPRAAPGPIQVGLLVAAIGWILDQATKALAVEALVGGRVIDLPGPLFLRLTFNAGAAFSAPIPWWAFPIVTLLVVVLVARNLPRARDALEPIAWGLLLAGAFGNLTDRLVRVEPGGVGRGEVVDFIASTVWPTFNLADVAITVGFLLLLFAAVREGREERQGAP